MAMAGWIIMHPPRYPHPNPQNLCICYLAWQKGFVDVIKDLQMGWLFWIIWGEGPSVITGILLRGRQEDQRRSRSDSETKKLLEGAMSQGMQVTSASWKRQEIGFFFSEPLGRTSPADTLILAHGDLILEFWVSEL